MGMSHLARFCPLEGVVLGLQQEELRAEGIVMVASGDFEPPAWFRLSQVTCAESPSLSTRQGAGLWAHGPCPQLTAKGVCPAARCQLLGFYACAFVPLVITRKHFQGFPQERCRGDCKAHVGGCPDGISVSPLSSSGSLQNGLAAREDITSLRPRFHC